MSVVFLGDPHAGKTALIRALCGAALPTHYEPTVGTDSYLLRDMTLFDYAGNERFHSAPAGGPLLCVLVLDAAAGRLSSLDAWHDEFLQFWGPGATFLLAATKCDEGHRCVCTADLAVWAGSIPFVECCAFTGEGVPALADRIRDCLCTAAAAAAPVRPPGQVVVVWADAAEALWPRVDPCKKSVVVGSAPALTVSSLIPHAAVGAAAFCVTVNPATFCKAEAERLQARYHGATLYRDKASVLWCFVCSDAARAVDVAQMEGLCRKVGAVALVLPAACPFVPDASWDVLGAAITSSRAALQLARLPSNVAACANEGCSWSGWAPELDCHRRGCPRSVVSCRFDGCSARVVVSDLAAHEQSCKQRPPACPFCQLPVTGLLADHAAVCPHRQQHLRTYAHCPFRTFGCTATDVSNAHLHDHVATGHMLFVANALHAAMDTAREASARCHLAESTAQALAATLKETRAELDAAQAAIRQLQTTVGDLVIAQRL